MANKTELREKFIAIRNALTPEYKKESQITIERKVKWFIDHYNLKKIGLYVSKENEVKTKELIEYCIDNNVDVYLPKIINDKEMNFFLVRDLELDLELNSKIGVYEPIIGKCVELENVNELSALFVPLVAFDRELNRIGTGKGYYDRWFNSQTYEGYKIGLSRITQLSDTLIDTLPTDVKLDFVITDKEVFVPFGDDDSKQFDYDVTYWRLGEDYDQYK